MKTWTTPEIKSLDINATAAQSNGTNHGKMCKNYPTIPCGAQGGGKGVCKNCPYDITGGVNILS